MARISIGLPVGATNIIPRDSSINRTMQDGTQPIIQLLLGSGFQIDLEGDFITSNTGDIVGGTVQVDAENSRLKITGAAPALGSYSTELFRFDDKVYMYPGTVFRVNQKIPTATPNDTVRVSFKLIDDSTDDKFYLEFQGEAAGSKQVASEEVDGVKSELYSGTFGALTELAWEFRYQQQGLDKIYLDDSLDGNYNKVWTGTVSADIRTAKVELALETEDNTEREISSDFIYVYYPNFAADYDLTDANRFKGDCKVYDTTGSETESDWVQVFSPDHRFTGDRVIQNGLMRIRFDGIDTNIYAYTSGAYTYVYRVRYRDKENAVATSLVDVIFYKQTTPQLNLIVRYNNGDMSFDMRRGCPYARVTMAKNVEINTSKSRMCVPGTIQYFRENKAHDEGNPLVIGTNPYTFTDDTDADTGIQLMNSRYIALFDNVDDDKAGFISFMKRPTSMQAVAASNSDLGTVTVGFANPAGLGLGVLVGNFSTDTDADGIVDGLDPDSAQDAYIKYRADEAGYSYNQSYNIKKRR